MRSFNMKLHYAVSALALIGLSSTQSVLALDYRFSNLTSLGGNTSYAKDINDQGQVVGYSYTTNNNAFRATLWQGTATQDLGAVNNSNSQAYAINNAGQVVGYSYTGTSGSSTRHATVWNSSGMTDLTPTSIKDTFATDINEAGAIVGYGAVNASGSAPKYNALVWENGLTTTLPAPDGPNGSYVANSNNNVGQVVGASTPANFSSGNAVIWEGSQYATVENLNLGTAYDINDAGIFVGSQLIGKQYLATMWTGDSVLNLGSLGSSSTAFSVNNANQAVGVSYVNGQRVATMWEGGTVIDLNSFLDNSSILAGWVLNEATAINNNGWIVGNASNANLGLINEAFMLAVQEPISSVPVPGALPLMLTGLGLLGFAKRKKA
jgi:probable HAF family extracellular repeat protein